jgi:hypothetical protein
MDTTGNGLNPQEATHSKPLSFRLSRKGARVWLIDRLFSISAQKPRKSGLQFAPVAVWFLELALCKAHTLTPGSIEL